jgi:hypothetical protein
MFGRSTVFDQRAVLTTGVVICVPTNGMVHARFTYCLTRAMDYAKEKGIQTVLEMDEGTVLSNQRQVLLDKAIEDYAADHILWLDSDMTFPPDTIVRLLAHRKKVVCATYSKRVEPFHATAFDSIDPVVPVQMNQTGLINVRYSGMGCMLVKAAVVDHIPRPHFPLKWHAPTATWQGEDMGFCDLLYSEGVKIACDLDLSRELGHLGQQEFRL